MAAPHTPRCPPLTLTASTKGDGADPPGQHSPPQERGWGDCSGHEAAVPGAGLQEDRVRQAPAHEAGRCRAAANTTSGFYSTGCMLDKNDFDTPIKIKPNIYKGQKFW